jgi:hypothetical protein
MNVDLTPKAIDPSNPEHVKLPSCESQGVSSYSITAAAQARARGDDYPALNCEQNGVAYGGLSSVLIPVEQTSLVSTFNIMVVVIIVLVLILIYYVMQLQKKQSCKSVRRPKSIQPANDPLDLSVVQDQSMQGFQVNRALLSDYDDYTDYMSYGNVPVHSSNSAVLAVGTYDGQTYIPNSSKNKLMRDALQKRLMGARSRTDDQSMVEYENARKMG